MRDAGLGGHVGVRPSVISTIRTRYARRIDAEPHGVEEDTTVRVTRVWVSALFGTLLLAGCAGSDDPGVGQEEPDGATSDRADSGSGAADDTTPITFADPVFEKLLKAELGQDEITPADLAGYQSVQIAADEFVLLTGNDRDPGSIVFLGEDTFEYADQRYTGYGSMTTLADLAAFPDLNSVFITLQPGIDYTTFPGLDRVEILSITQSKLTDVGFLSAASHVRYLTLDTNAITDVSPLAACASVVGLYLSFNQVADLTPIAGLTTLTSLYAYRNQISDISPLAGLSNLEKIGFYENQISDISALAGLPNLTYVELTHNTVEDVSPLAGFASFDRLALSGNPVRNIEVLDHIDNLEF